MLVYIMIIFMCLDIFEGKVLYQTEGTIKMLPNYVIPKNNSKQDIVVAVGRP